MWIKFVKKPGVPEETHEACTGFSKDTKSRAGIVPEIPEEEIGHGTFTVKEYRYGNKKRFFIN